MSERPNAVPPAPDARRSPAMGARSEAPCQSALIGTGDRFRLVEGAWRVIGLATTQSPGITLQVWRSTADADVTVPPPT